MQYENHENHENHIITLENTNIMKIIEFQLKINKIKKAKKIIKFQKRIKKIMKSIEFHDRINSNHENHRSL